MGKKNPKEPGLRRRRRVHYRRPEPRDEVLRIVEARLTRLRYEAKSIKGYRQALRMLAADGPFWIQLEQLKDNIEALKTSIDVLG